MSQWLRKNLLTITFLVEKYDLNLKQVIDAFIKAKGDGTSHCGTLKITCREMNEDSAVFLVTEGEKVVGQFPVQLKFFKDVDHLKKEVLKAEFERESWKRRLKLKPQPRERKIAELKVGMKAHVHGKIIEKSPNRTVSTQWSGLAILSNLTLADDSGKVGLCLWNEEIDRFHVGDEVEIKNGLVYHFADRLQLKFRRKNISLK